jgi:hypothetical protein
VTTLGDPYFGNAHVLGQCIYLLFVIIWEKNPTNYYYFIVVPAGYHGKRGEKKKRKRGQASQKVKHPHNEHFIFQKARQQYYKYPCPIFHHAKI